MKLGATDSIKFKKLKMRLGLPHWQAVGLLESVWRFVERDAPLGDIGRHPDDDIAAAIEWTGDPSELIQALVECRWLDRSEDHRLVVHDWADHMPTWLVGNLKRHGKTVVGNGPAKQPAKEYTKQVAKQTTKQPAEEPTQQPPSYPRDSIPSDSKGSEESLSDQESDGSVPVSAKQLVELWNSTPGTVRCQKLTPKRLKAIAARTRDPTWAYVEALKKFPLNCFSDGSWTPNIDWFCRPDTVVLIIEGKYDWRKNSSFGRSAAPAQSKFESNISALERFAASDQDGIRDRPGAPVRSETNIGIQ